METTKVSTIIDVDSTNWDEQVARSKQLVLVDFWHDACTVSYTHLTLPTICSV